MQQNDVKRIVTAWLPPVAGVALIVLFVSLANWQLERAAEKEALAALFEPDATPVAWRAGEPYTLFTPLTVSGRYLAGQQLLIDNIIENGRVGYYVITPFETTGGRLLLVNRGWLSKEQWGERLPLIDVDDGERTIAARAGRLPRVGLRPDIAIEDGQDWPKRAVYPRLVDIETELGRDLSMPLLLLDPAAADGFARNWAPPATGSRMHYGYAFQWSALALTVLVILGWQMRKRIREGQRDT